MIIKTYIIKGNRGMITMVTLWILAILSLIALGLGYRVGIDLKIARYQLDQIQLLYAAKSGIQRAAAELLLDGNTSTFDYLAESWCGSEQIFKDISLETGSFRVGWASEENEFAFRDDWTFGLIDEDRKINVYKASEEMINRLSEIGFSSGFLTKLTELLDNTDLPSQIEITVFPEGDKPTSNDIIGPLPLGVLLDEGCDQRDLDMARRYLTVYGEGKVNINTASREVLFVLGVPAELVERIVYYRAGSDGMDGTADDNPFESVEIVPEVLNDFGELSPEESAELTYFLKTEAFTVQSRFFSVNAVGSLNQGSASKKITAVLERTNGNEAVIRYWYEN